MCLMHLQPSKFGGMVQMCEDEHAFGFLHEDCRCCGGCCDECKKTDDIEEAAKKRLKTSLRELNKFQVELQGPLQDQLVQTSQRIDAQRLAETTRLDAEIKQNKSMGKKKQRGTKRTAEDLAAGVDTDAEESDQDGGSPRGEPAASSQLADDFDYSLIPRPAIQHSEQDKVLARLGR